MSRRFKKDGKWYYDNTPEDDYGGYVDPEFTDPDTELLLDHPMHYDSSEGYLYIDEDRVGACESCDDDSKYPYCKDECPEFREAHPEYFEEKDD